MKNKSSIVFNVSTILKWFSRPNGIIRVNVELISWFILDEKNYESFNIFFVRYCNDLKSFVRCEDTFLIDALGRLRVEIDKSFDLGALAEKRPYYCPFIFKKDDIFLTMGFDWDDYPSSELIKISDQQVKILVVIYDLIPIKYPNHCIKSVVSSFPYFLNYVSWAASKIITISESACKDMKDFFGKNIWRSPEIIVNYLGSDSFYRRESNAQAGVKNKKYQICYVSTIEPRKNHKVLLNAYKILLDEGFSPPEMIFIGNEGWGGVGNSITQELSSYPLLGKYVRIMSGLSDEQLSKLMNESIFSVFPSEYEGWGLPVVESLSMGVPVICSNSSSLPEASQNLAIMLPANDPSAWANEIKNLSSDKMALREIELNLLEKFQKRYWSQFSSEMTEVISSL